jgi:predicted helicase
MSSQIASYLSKVAQSLASGHATEHSYRPELRDLFVALTKYNVINEPKGSEHGKPDFIFLSGQWAELFPVAYGEAKDIHINLEKTTKSEQLARYFGYARLILTNGIEFRFFKNGSPYGEPITLATKTGNTLKIHEEKFDSFADTLSAFLTESVDSIRSSKHLAQIMGGKARRIRDNLREMLTEENRTAGKYADIFALYDIFKKEILHDLDYHNFADLYAQTLVYGLFVARYNDTTPENFTRSEARDLVPKSNPLLRKFFDHIAGEGFEKRLGYIVDELCDVFAHADVRALMHGLYQKADIETHDPVIHFYEDFLGEYDASMRKQRWVFYTPAPVVRFIVRAVDDILKTHFWLKRWLADTSKIKHETMGHVTDKRGKMSTKSLTEEVHRVQILDPATGTGTFLNEVIRHIHGSMKDQAGIWPSYVQNDLIPRLHGFELMMASYTIAHLKLGLTLAETGVSELDQRLQVYLTNSLEEAKTNRETQGTLFGLAESITREGQYADEVKADKPIMVILGNPPYSGISTNNGEWISKKIEDYKYVNGEHFGERKHWLQDDYVKFFRLAESLVEKNEEWVLWFITNHGYLDNPTFRGMRWHLLQTFDHIYIVDLHGNGKKRETALDGTKDENVFDIQAWTAIFIGVKTGKKKAGGCAEVLHIDQYGKRNAKYDWLEINTLETSQKLVPQAPYYFFIPKDLSLDKEYQKWFGINQIFIENWLWAMTWRDDFTLFDSSDELNVFQNQILLLSENEIRNKYPVWKDTSNWNLQNALQDLKTKDINDIWVSFTYRPFDTKYTLYTWRSSWFHSRPQERIWKHFLHKNLALISWRAGQNVGGNTWNLLFITDALGDLNLFYRWWATMFPLYLYSDSENLENQTRTPNLDETIWSAINAIVWETTPEQILDYIYAVLHSPLYREKYREFLKIDFPRVPYPRDRESFLALVALGGELRSLHLLESSKVEDFITTYPVAGDNVVEAVKYVDEKVFINATQYFGGVPESVWTHPIGGYMSAQKWLKDRKGRTLTNDDIMHYQRMIVALSETARVMEEADRVINV